MKTTCGIFLYQKADSKILIGHASRSKDHWSIPKGLKDEGETCYQAAIRELKEETGIDAVKINILQTFELPAVKYKKQNKTLESFLIITDSFIGTDTLKCHSLVNGKYPEIDRFEWVDLATLEKKAHETQASQVPYIREILKKEII